MEKFFADFNSIQIQKTFSWHFRSRCFCEKGKKMLWNRSVSFFLLFPLFKFRFFLCIFCSQFTVHMLSTIFTFFFTFCWSVFLITKTKRRKEEIFSIFLLLISIFKFQLFSFYFIEKRRDSPDMIPKDYDNFPSRRKCAEIFMMHQIALSFKLLKIIR